MSFDKLRSQVAATTERFRSRSQIRDRNQELIDQGRFLAVDKSERVIKFIKRNGVDTAAAESYIINKDKGLPLVEESLGPMSEPNALERIMGISDLMGVSFLEKGLVVARSVCRIWVNITGGRPEGFGTGSLVSPQLLLTNNHVIDSIVSAKKSQAEFNYQLGMLNSIEPSDFFALDPDTFFISDKTLDYTLVAVRPFTTSGKALSYFGYNPLIEDEGKMILPQFLNIIQHPNGEPKQLALRENQAIDLLENFVHYKTDTAPGSSGSPVYNDAWELVALHHSGVWATDAAGNILSVDGKIWTENMGEDRIKWLSNEGVRISRIINHVRAQQLSNDMKKMFEAAFVPQSFNEIQADAGFNNSKGFASNNSGSNDNSTGFTGFMQSNEDGEASWTFPLTVSVKLGGIFGHSKKQISNDNVEVPTIEKPGSAVATSIFSIDLNSSPEAILQEAKDIWLKRNDVISIRLGYCFEDNWITNKRALFISVRDKKTVYERSREGIPALPQALHNLPIRVLNPTIQELFRMSLLHPSAAETTSFNFPEANEIVYFPPANTPLKQLEEEMSLIAHTSPDQGWPELEQFIAGTERTLIIAMYDFGAPHVVEAIEKLAEKDSFERLVLVIQSGQSLSGRTKVNDITDQEVIDRFASAFGDRFEFVYVKMGAKNGWVDRSYHIKVMVRDESVTWLSSGNLQSSNQPPADPLHENPQTRKWLNDYNREWNVVAHSRGLSATFQKYILHDLVENEILRAEEEVILPDLLFPDLLIPVAEEAVKPFHYFKSLRASGIFKVTPILTPDNYLKEVIPMIESANSEIIVQNQTINVPTEYTEALSKFLEAILKRQKKGVKVRLIFRAFNASDDMINLSGLVDLGFKAENIRLQKNCHTKGIIVDDRLILIGSQNISNLGISNNRDASLLFDNAKIAKYFKEIFEHDWHNLAKPKITPEELAPLLATNTEATEGMTRVSWKDYLELL